VVRHEASKARLAQCRQPPGAVDGVKPCINEDLGVPDVMEPRRLDEESGLRTAQMAGEAVRLRCDGPDVT
jgi:hypothetical protein